jgi:hypothetical protein
MTDEGWDGAERRVGECVAEPTRACPWTHPDKLAEVETRIAKEAGEIAGRMWWRGFPWVPFLGLITIVGTLSGLLWKGLDSSVVSVAYRITVVERATNDHLVSNATTSAQLDGLKAEVVRLSSEIQVLSRAFNERNDLVAENNVLLKRLSKER